jgi:exosortase
MKRTMPFAICVILSILIAGAPIEALIRLAYNDERYSYILLIPFISLLLFCLERKEIRLVSRYCPMLGVPIIISSIVLFSMINLARNAGTDTFRLPASIISVVCFWLGSFILVYGVAAFRASRVSWCFLILIVPLPAAFLDKLVVAMQVGSADAASLIFGLTGMPAVRDGVQFSLPGVDIEIAKQCSGIRSGIALVLANSLAVHLILRSYLKKIVLTLLSIPFVIFKNALRIVTIAWLGVYVDRGFFSGDLHRNSGIVFSVLDVVVMITVIILFQHSEGAALAVNDRTESRTQGSIEFV